jgi:hypothetical protein
MPAYPKSREELEAENAVLREQVGTLQQSVGSLQAALFARDAEIHRLRNPKPKPKPQVLDPSAADKFARPHR